MEQQHSAHTGGKDPGQRSGPGSGPGPEAGQSQGKKQGKKGRSRERSAGRPQGPAHDEEHRRHRPPHAPGTRTAAAAATAATASSSTAASSTVSGHTPDAGSGSASREPRRRAGAGAVRQEAAALYQAQLRFPLIPAPLTDAFSWLPRARLTALGSGLMGVVLMVLAGAGDAWLLEGSSTVYGAVFLGVSVACAAWVRPTDLAAAPVAVPLAFTAGLYFLGGGGGHQSYTERLTNLFPALAVNAFWLYGGTLLAVLIATTRKIALMVQQSRVRALMEAEDAEDEAAQTDGAR